MAWLGPGDGSPYMAFPGMNAIADSWNRMPKFLQQLPIPDEHIDEYRRLVEAELGREDSLDMWQNVSTFLQRRWFSRAWILQEVCCASNVIVFSNAQVIELSTPADVCRFITQLSLNFKHTTLRSWKPKNWHPFIWKVWSDFMPIFSTEITPYRDLLASVDFYQSHRAKGKLPELPDILDRLRRTKASDSRDKVYAARSLSNVELEVDYNKTSEEVFTDTALAILETSYGLNLLDHCYPPIERSLSLPSWVPDWTRSRDLDYVPLPKRGELLGGANVEDPLYSAGGQGGRSEPQYNSAKRLLVIPAFLWDGFNFVGTDLYHAEDNSSLARSAELIKLIINPDQVGIGDQRQDFFQSLVWLHEWAVHRTAREQLTVKDSDSERVLDLDSWVYDGGAGGDQFLVPIYKPTGDSVQMAYFRTLFCDLAINSVDYQEHRLSKQLSTLDRRPVNRLSCRVFACSNLGFFALVPRETISGDQIAIVRGHEVPLVVRKKDECFQLIGECYVHGIMDGELARYEEAFGWLPLI